MDDTTNIYSEPLWPVWPVSQGGYEPSQGSSGSSQTPSPSCKERSQAQQQVEEASGLEREFDLEDLVVFASELTQDYCTTGCNQLDAELRGGIPAFGITELFGEAGSGKTQICLQLSITAQLKEEAGGLNSDVLYISTEDSFPANRLAELVLHFQSKYSTELLPDPMSHVFIERIPDSEKLLQCLSVKLANLARISARGVRLVVIDSMAAIFRSGFDDISRRTSELRRLGQILHEFSMEHNAAIVICNQVTGKPSSSRNERNIASLGMVWKNMVTTRIGVSKSEGAGDRKLKVSFSPHIPSSIDIPFQVYADGIRGKAGGEGAGSSTRH